MKKHLFIQSFFPFRNLSFFRTFLFLFVLLATCLSHVHAYFLAQGQKKEPLSEYSKQWLEEVVPYIIMPAEKEVFLSLANEEERGKFIENFWKKRDPNPSTPENEFKLAYYRRIAFTNKFFGLAAMPGWKTDRGRIFILLGPPNEIQHDYFYAADSMSRPGAVKEIWTYWDLPNPNLPYSVEFVFVDRYGTGNYLLETSLGQKDGLSSSLDLQTVHQHFNEMEILAEAMKNPFEKTEKLREIITTEVSYNLVPFACDTLARKGVEGRNQAILFFSIPLDSLQAKAVEGKNNYSLTIMVAVSNELGQSIMEKTQEINFQPAISEETALDFSHYLFPLSLSLASGHYGLHLLLLDNFSGKIGTLHKKIAIPDFTAKELSMSDILLSSAAAKPDESRPSSLPFMKKEYKSNEEVRLEFEVYNFALDPEAKKGRLRVNLFFYKGDELLTSSPPIKKEVEQTTDCRIETSLRLRHFQPGNYLLRVDVTDEVGSVSCFREVNFRII